MSCNWRIRPGTSDCDGVDPGTFTRSARRARLAYVTPSHQLPSGVTMSLCRRLALLEWAADRGAFVFEDDYDSEYRYEGRPIEAMQGLVEPFVAAKWLNDRHTPTLEQRVLADFIVEGHFERHLRRSRTRNAARRAAPLAALDRHLGDRVEVQGAKAGIHMIA
jgi:GntR family transcriptional regulator/MocR family aminotransferase